jgi:nitroimidazol reductase NimA-like FMN-containing flavoprotein (pyridoxamine 5'-phosphate oxidase superfamily)
MTDPPDTAATPRTRVRRVPERGRYDRETIEAILDEALVCHVGIVSDGSPVVIPMACARDGDRLLLHGSTASRLLKTLTSGAEVCVTVTHLDGVVVARSVFHSSMNYRSAVVIGRAEVITDPRSKLGALQTLVERLIPGRWDEVRETSEKELRATTILSLSLTESSAKIRSGPPKDDEEDLSLDIWAGEVPLRTISLDPVTDPLLESEKPVPASVERFRKERVPPEPEP